MDFDAWRRLAETDLEEFEARREAAVGDLIRRLAGGDPQKAQRLRAVQWRIDRERERCRHPLVFAGRLYARMWDAVLRPGGLLDQINRMWQHDLKSAVAGTAAAAAILLLTSVVASAATYEYRVPVHGVPLPASLLCNAPSVTFNYDPANAVVESNGSTHSVYHVTVPANCGHAVLRIVGAGGGGASSSSGAGNGGNGGQVYETIPIPSSYAGTSWTIYAGGGGAPGSGYSGGIGGGLSAVFAADGTLLGAAGSGGGAGSYGGQGSGVNGGAGGGPSGAPGAKSYCEVRHNLRPATPGTQTGPGLGGPGDFIDCTTGDGNNGSGYEGGARTAFGDYGNGGGGGGGDGYYGGGGGYFGGFYYYGGGGAGGSGYSPPFATNVTNQPNATPGGAAGSYGGNGWVTINWKP